MKLKLTTKKLTAMALLAACVYITSAYIQITIPTMLGVTRVHLGNAFCLLSGFILGPLAGGLSAGLGSVLFDLTNPLYVASAPFTFVFKFLLAFVCGKIARSNINMPKQFKYLLAAIAGSFTYILLYLGKEFVSQLIFFPVPLSAVWPVLLTKLGASSFNAIIATIVSLLLFKSLEKYSIED